MELFFLLVLILIMATALGSGYPVAFALPGAAILTSHLLRSLAFLRQAIHLLISTQVAHMNGSQLGY